MTSDLTYRARVRLALRLLFPFAFRKRTYWRITEVTKHGG